MDNTNTRRLPALDGLRGLAAFAVLLSHTLMTVPAFSQGSSTPRSWESVGDWVTWSPLHLLWEGTAAVIVFFVLSGYVLTIAMRNAPRARWAAYYPSRLLRLYLPVWGAVALGLAVTAATPRDVPLDGLSWWAQGHDQTITGSSALGYLTLWSTDWHISALWSLQYEVVFSLLLPVYVYAAARCRGALAVLATVGLIAASGAGVILGVGALTFLPSFGIGALMATNRAALADVAARLPAVAWWGIAATAVAGLTNAWLPVLDVAGLPGKVAGAALAVFLFLEWSPAKRLGESKVVQWLGTVSFSLYLVHEPLVVLVAYLTPGAGALLRIALAVPVALLVAWAFYRACEAPAHRLSQRAKGRQAPARPAAR